MKLTKPQWPGGEHAAQEAKNRPGRDLAVDGLHVTVIHTTCKYTQSSSLPLNSYVINDDGLLGSVYFLLPSKPTATWIKNFGSYIGDNGDTTDGQHHQRDHAQGGTGRRGEGAPHPQRLVRVRVLPIGPPRRQALR